MDIEELADQVRGAFVEGSIAARYFLAAHERGEEATMPLCPYVAESIANGRPSTEFEREHCMENFHEGQAWFLGLNTELFRRLRT